MVLNDAVCVLRLCHSPCYFAGKSEEKLKLLFVSKTNLIVFYYVRFGLCRLLRYKLETVHLDLRDAFHSSTSAKVVSLYTSFIDLLTQLFKIII